MVTHDLSHRFLVRLPVRDIGPEVRVAPVHDDLVSAEVDDALVCQPVTLPPVPQLVGVQKGLAERVDGEALGQTLTVVGETGVVRLTTQDQTIGVIQVGVGRQSGVGGLRRLVRESFGQLRASN